MADEEGDSLAESIAAEKGEGAETEEETGAEGEESEEGTESEGESEEGSEEGEEGEGEESEASGPDEEESEEGEEDEGEEEPRSRGRNRVQKLAEERNRLRAENEELRRRANGGGQGGGGGAAAAPTQQTPQQVREAIKSDVTKLMDGFEFLTPADRAERLLQAQERVLNTVMGPLRYSAAEQQDRSSFKDRYGSNPLYKRLSAKVEERAAEAKRQGLFIPRETLFKDLIGDETLRQITKGGGSQRRQAEARRAKAKGTPTKGRGDAGKGGGKSRLQNLEERLEGKLI